MKLLHITVTDKGQGIDEFVSMAINCTRRVYRDRNTPENFAIEMLNQNYYVLEELSEGEQQELVTRLEATGIVDLVWCDGIHTPWIEE